MTLQPLTDAEKDYAYAQGILEGWLDQAPAQIKEHLSTLVGGISAYREKYTGIQEDYNRLNELYSKLMGQSAQYLQMIQDLREEKDQLLLDIQRDLHQKHPSAFAKPLGGIVNID